MQDFYRSPPSQPTDNAGTLSSQLSCVGDEHPKEWPKSNIKRFVSKFMKTFKTILQCYLIQINILAQFITIKGVTNTIFSMMNIQFFLLKILWLFYGQFFVSNNWMNIIFPNLFQFIPPEGLIIKYWYLWKHLVTVLIIFMCSTPFLINEKGIKTLGNGSSKSYKQTHTVTFNVTFNIEDTK